LKDSNGSDTEAAEAIKNMTTTLEQSIKEKVETLYG
jgi:hypothetical protein